MTMCASPCYAVSFRHDGLRLSLLLNLTLQEMLWGGISYNVAGQFLDSSDGFTLDEATSRVLTVQTSFAASNTDCDPYGIANAADAAVAAAGVALADYCLRVYLLPAEGVSCFWAGLGYVDCTCGNCRTWTNIASQSNPGLWANIVTHELGHNLSKFQFMILLFVYCRHLQAW